ncbi:MAG TPA: pantoate--beta-alanine ligase [bacterium]
MIVIRSHERMARLAARWEREGRRIGFVPTMGALHAGHGALIRAARRESDRVIVSVFVNPLQFGPREDFARYPRTLRRDCAAARAAGADVVFAPRPSAMFPGGFDTAVDVGAVAAGWEGRARPGHFRGVATVVLKLLLATRAAVLVLGQKDYQQTRVLARLVSDLGIGARLLVCPTVREPDGLALSSRNRSLTRAQRARAGALNATLRDASRMIRRGARSAPAVNAFMRRRLDAVPGLRVEYAAAADAATLEPVRRLGGRIALLAAVRLGRARLIDNVLVDVP